MTEKNIPSLRFLKIAVNALKSVQKQEDKWQKTFDEMFDGHLVPQYNNCLRNAIISMVEEAFYDKPDPTWGSTFTWWVYDTEFGKRKKLTESVTVNGKKIPMDAVEDLYDYYKMMAKK